MNFCTTYKMEDVEKENVILAPLGIQLVPGVWTVTLTNDNSDRGGSCAWGVVYNVRRDVCLYGACEDDMEEKEEEGNNMLQRNVY